jgi:hypothetical protein
VCHHGSTLPHPRTSITERKVWPAVDAEVEHARLAIRRVRAGSRKDEAKLEALAAKRLRIGENYNDGVYDKAERDRRLAEVAKAEAGLTARRWVMQFTMPADVERDRPEVVNNYLRRLWDRVDLDPVTFQPARFEWRDPSLRA